MVEQNKKHLPTKKEQGGYMVTATNPVSKELQELKDLKNSVTDSLRTMAERVGIDFDVLCHDARLVTTPEYRVPCVSGTMTCKWLFKTDEIGVAKNYASAGTRVIKHHHAEYKTITIISGKMVLTMDKMSTVLRAGDAFSVPPNTPHKIFTPEESVYISVAIPPFKSLANLPIASS